MEVNLPSGGTWLRLNQNRTCLVDQSHYDPIRTHKYLIRVPPFKTVPWKPTKWRAWSRPTTSHISRIN